MIVSPVEANDARAELRRAKTILREQLQARRHSSVDPCESCRENERLFFRSYDQAWKTKRIRHNSKVEVAPSTLRGKPTGDPLTAHALLLEGEDAKIAARARARAACASGAGGSDRPSTGALSDDALRATPRLSFVAGITCSGKDLFGKGSTTAAVEIAANHAPAPPTASHIPTPIARE